MRRFLDFYRAKGWKLGGGEVMSEIQDLIRPAESWTVKEQTETGFNPYFIKGWRELYNEVPKSLKMEFLKIRTPQRSLTYSNIICPDAVKHWLDENKERVEQIFKNYKLEW